MSSTKESIKETKFNHSASSEYAELAADILKEIDPSLRQEMKGKSLGLILLECELYTYQTCKRGNRLFLELRKINQAQLNDTVRQKCESYNRIISAVALPALEGVAQVFVASLCGPLGQGAFQAIATGARATTDNLNKKQQSDLSRYDHLTFVLQSEIKRDDDGKQDHKATAEKALEIFIRKIESDKQLFLSLVQQS